MVSICGSVSRIDCSGQSFSCCPKAPRPSSATLHLAARRDSAARTQRHKQHPSSSQETSRSTAQRLPRPKKVSRALGLLSICSGLLCSRAAPEPRGAHAWRRRTRSIAPRTRPGQPPSAPLPFGQHSHHGSSSQAKQRLRLVAAPRALAAGPPASWYRALLYNQVRRRRGAPPDPTALEAAPSPYRR